MLDCQLFDLNPFWHHLTSLLFHVANALLLFWVLKRMTGDVWPSAFVAAVFALHPLQVDSVAWVAERKNVLSTLFWILTVAAYVRYTEHPGIGRYLLVVLAFSLGLMSKPTVVTLPFVLLLLDFWPLGRLQWGRKKRGAQNLLQAESAKVCYQQLSAWRLIREKVPLFILAAILSVITFFVQHTGGAVSPLTKIPLDFRIANAFISYLKYIGKVIWPSRLAIFYPHPAGRFSMAGVVTSALLLVLFSICCIYAARRRRYPAVGWLWYVGTLVPVIGLVQAGAQAMADRYMYIPMIGLLIVIAWGVNELVAEWRYRRIVTALSAIAVLSAAVVSTRIQVKYWQNSLTLFGHALKVTENNHIAHNSYACALFEEGDLNGAVLHLSEALRISPTFSTARDNLGRVFLKQGRLNEAIACFGKLLQVRKDSPDVYCNLGLAFTGRKEYDNAIKCFSEALRIKPEYLEARNRMGRVFLVVGKLDQAVACFNEVLRSKRDQPDVHTNLGLAYSQMGRYDLAIAHWAEAVKLKPDSSGVLNNLAWILATTDDTKVQNPTRAVEFAQRACELTDYKAPEVLDTLAVAYAASGKFPDAINAAEKACKLAHSAGKEDLAVVIQKRLQLYRSGRPYRHKQPSVDP
jgi:tetratricopeptide (TPR) repeat protein